MSKRNNNYKLFGNYTRRSNRQSIILMPKTHNSRMNSVQTYKANCVKNKLQGYKSLKTGDDNTDFGHVLMGNLDGYTGTVIIKVSDMDIYYKREKTALSAIEGFRYHAKIICDFTCNDDKERWMKNIHNLYKSDC